MASNVASNSTMLVGDRAAFVWLLISVIGRIVSIVGTVAVPAFAIRRTRIEARVDR